MKNVLDDPAPARHTVSLDDGRQLAFAELGRRDGAPVIYFHGFPGSRLEARLVEKEACRAGIRLVAIDRPGMGLSSPRTGRTIIDWPRDVVQVADSLKLASFIAVGASGGAPYALACAAAIPERLDAVGIIAGIAPVAGTGLAGQMLPVNRLGLVLARRAPLLLRMALGVFAFGVRRWPARLLDRIASRLGPADRAVLQETEVRGLMSGSLCESFRAGSAGPAADLSLLGRPWGFDLEAIGVPVRLWHGRADVVCPATMGEFLARRVRNCAATYYDDEGHFSVVTRRAPEIFEALLALANRTRHP